MKYFFLLFISLLFLNSCDDGDLITEDFVFENVEIQKCTNSNILLKINGQEALIFNTPDTDFPNQVTPAGTPRIINISGNTSLVYKKFTSTISNSDICSSPTVAVTEEWPVSGGTVEIVTNEILKPNTTEIIAYNHKITFKNITFNAPGKKVIYDTYTFGNYRTEIINLNFNYTLATTQKCDNKNLIFKTNNNNVLLLDVPSTMFENTPTPIGQPRTALINSTTHKVIYRVYDGNLNTNFFCASITPTTPILNEEWVAQNGVNNTSGIIRVETVASGSSFKHTISLYKTVFKKGVYTYIYPTNDVFVFGEYITN